MFGKNEFIQSKENNWGDTQMRLNNLMKKVIISNVTEIMLGLSLHSAAIFYLVPGNLTDFFLDVLNVNII